MFWVPEEKDEFGFPHASDRVHKFGEWLAHGSIEPEPKVGEAHSWDRDRPVTWLYKFLLWVDGFKERKVKIHIDRWDTWSMDHTLAEIVLPMLKQLKETKHGSQYVDLDDVPKELRYETKNEWDEQLSFDFYNEDKVEDGVHVRWDWVLDEMIWAFEQHVKHDADEEFWTGEFDKQWVKQEDGNYQMIDGPNDTMKFHKEAFDAYHARKANGFRLFGKYYQGLWD
jgi:hypothetical protein